MKFDWCPLSNEQMEFYRNLCPPNQFCILKTGKPLPGISSRLTSKCASTIFLASSGDADGKIYYLANLIRTDLNDPNGFAVDQMPFGFVIDTSMQALSGVLVQHGNWEGRTNYPPPAEWENVLSERLDTFKELTILPKADSGNISQLDCPTQKYAFSVIINKLSTVFLNRKTNN